MPNRKARRAKHRAMGYTLSPRRIRQERERKVKQAAVKLTPEQARQALGLWAARGGKPLN